MRQLSSTLVIVAIFIFTCVNAQNPQLDFNKIKAYEHQLDDVMEIIDTNQLKTKLKKEEENYSQNPSEINKVRLGIIYHETALNLSFFSETTFKGYAKKSFDILSELYKLADTKKELLPFISSYRASALSFVSAETRDLKLLSEAFDLFSESVANYSAYSYLPEFLRGSVAENLPWYFFSKRKFAKLDFQSIINKQALNKEYSNWKIMSFTYWAWAKQHQSRKDRDTALSYLEKAILLDPNYEAGRQKAEKLKTEMIE